MRFRASNKRLVREHNERMTQAYYTAVIPMMKKPPKLADLLTHYAGPARKSWRDIKAALLFAMPPKTEPRNPE